VLVDANTPNSPGWWLLRLGQRLEADAAGSTAWTPTGGETIRCDGRRV
jgi:hypothetical protein